ncbi:hypothetical protein BJ742DRAFT_851349 [Cladochytrium replicatum]|nr:hypothetical protein BJ742DRAFT_851349 [Cladochytrium replicatum]
MQSSHSEISPSRLVLLLFIALACIWPHRFTEAGSATQLGCFKDGPLNDMRGAFVWTSNMNPEYCLGFCTGTSSGPYAQYIPPQRAFPYAGLSYGGVCSCANEYGSYGKTNMAFCNLTCPSGGNCGGTGFISVWRTWILLQPDPDATARCPVTNSGVNMTQAQADIERTLMMGYPNTWLTTGIIIFLVACLFSLAVGTAFLKFAKDAREKELRSALARRDTWRSDVTNAAAPSGPSQKKHHTTWIASIRKSIGAQPNAVAAAKSPGRDPNSNNAQQQQPLREPERPPAPTPSRFFAHLHDDAHRVSFSDQQRTRDPILPPMTPSSPILGEMAIPPSRPSTSSVSISIPQQTPQTNGNRPQKFLRYSNFVARAAGEGSK